MNKNTINHYYNLTPLVFLFAFIIIGLSVAYSFYSTSFAVDGSGFVRPISDVRISAVEVNSETNGGYLNENLEFASHTFYVNGHVPAALGANGNLIVDVTITNLSSGSVLITDVSNTSFSNNNMTYEFLNITPNVTVIPAASDYTFQVKIHFKSGIIETILKFTEAVLETVFNISTNVTSTFQVSWSRMAQYTIDIQATPSDALILIMDGDRIIGSSSTGHFTGLVDAGSTINWSVSKNGYVTQSGVDVMDDNKSHVITLTTAAQHTLSITSVPSDATITLKQNGEVVASGTGSISYQTYDYSPIEYSVSKEGYITASDVVQTEGSNVSLNITLEEAEYLDGTYMNTDASSATTITKEIFYTGYYLVELWGGAGGKGAGNEIGNGQAGEAGYVNGIVYLNSGQNVYMTLGGNGYTGTSTSSATAGGANAGGTSAAGGGGGGGYSALAVDVNSITLANVLDNKVFFIAGGGGGGGAKIGSIGNSGSGGAGGNINSSATLNYDNGTIYNGSNGTTTNLNASYPASGGSNIGGTNSGSANAGGSLLVGGSGHRNGGGGGSGFYGGAGGASRDALIITIGGGSGGGGGSSYIHTSVTSSSSQQSNLVRTNPSSTGGAAVIKYIGTTLN